MNLEIEPFPRAQGPSLLQEQLHSYLNEWVERGWVVMRDKAVNGSEGYTIGIGTPPQIMIHDVSNGTCSVRRGPTGRVFVQHPRNEAELRAMVDELAHSLGVDPGERATATRLVTQQPLSNLSRLASLIGSRTVEAVFDPYLTVGALTNLLVLQTFGVQFGASLPCITSDKIVKGGKISAAASVHFAKESGAKCEVRTAASKQHRRFLLLSGGQSLIMGMSLNSIEVNEAAHLEDSSADQLFFDKEWASASPI